MRGLASSTSCVICLDSLFDRRDDLDEVWPIAAPDCGHVFHEQCLLEWFRSQSQAYIAQQREQGHRASSPSVSEAPAECPTCRAECYADQDTGNPQIHRLYINFGDGATAGGSSQVGSSPVRTPWKDRSKGKGREGRADAEVMGWAKRARGISVEVRDLAEEGKEVGEDDIGGVLRRAEALKEDLISQKAVEGIRNYVGGLTAALNNLRTSLASNPLIPVLRQKTAAAQAAQADAQRRMRELVETHIPQEIQRGVEIEQSRCERKIKKVKDEMALVQRELEKELVLRRTGRKEMEERLAVEVKKAADAIELANKEKADREALNATLAERTRSLRAYQAKAASRTVLKEQIRDLERERDALKAELKRSEAASSSSRRVSLSAYDNIDRTVPDDDDIGADGDVNQVADEQHDITQLKEDTSPDKSADLSVIEIDQTTFRPNRSRASAETHDDSLEVDYASLGSGNAASSFKTPVSHSGYVTAGRRPRPHPTARTVPFEIPGDDDADLPSGTKNRSTSKYFDAAVPLNDISGKSNVPAGPCAGGEMKYSRTNPFASSKADTERRKVLHQSATTPKSGNGKDGTSGLNKHRQVLDFTGPSSPESSPPIRRKIDSAGSGPAVTKGASAGGQKRSVAEMLGMTDKHGRPVKGLVTGAKVKRRA